MYCSLFLAYHVLATKECTMRLCKQNLALATSCRFNPEDEYQYLQYNRFVLIITLKKKKKLTLLVNDILGTNGESALVL